MERALSVVMGSNQPTWKTRGWTRSPRIKRRTSNNSRKAASESSASKEHKSSKNDKPKLLEGDETESSIIGWFKVSKDNKSNSAKKGIMMESIASESIPLSEAGPSGTGNPSAIAPKPEEKDSVGWTKPLPELSRDKPGFNRLEEGFKRTEGSSNVKWYHKQRYVRDV